MPIVGHEEPVVFPEHLTKELDCEVALALAVKKGGKHFAPEDAADYVVDISFSTTLRPVTFSASR